MNSTYKMPDYIIKSIMKKGTKRSDIIIFAISDLDLMGYFGEVCFVVTKEKLLIISEVINKNKKNSNDFKSLKIDQYSLKNLIEIKAEELIFGGRLIANVNNELTVLARYTNIKKSEFSNLVNVINKLVENKKIDYNNFSNKNEDNLCPKCKILYPDKNRKVCPKCLNKKSIFVRLLSYSKKYKFRVSLIILFMLLQSVLNSIVPYLTGVVFFDEILDKNGFIYGKIVLGIVLIVLTNFLIVLTNIIYGRINAYVTSNIIYDIKTLLFKSMQKLSINFYLNKQTGNLMTRVSGDTDNIQEFFHDGIPELFTNVVVIIIVIITMFIQNTLLTIISLSTTPILLIVSLKIFPIIKKKYTSMYISRSLLNSLVNDVLMGFRVVKAFGKEKEEIGRFSKSSSYVKKLEYNLAKFTNLIFQSMNILMISSSIIIWGFGGWQVINGQMEFGMLITFIGYVALINRPLIYMVQTTNWWSNAMNSAGRIFEILDSLPDIIEKKNPIVKRKFDGLIEFENINFSYEANKNILHNINMIIEPGEVIGIVGRSGAGKSTIANLLMRMYDTTKGEIRIDGVNIKNYAFKCLNKNIGMVMQDVFLFTGSISENIAYAKPDSSMEEIINAAKVAFAHDFILKLPYGYDTVIGKNAQSLSGGEKQRLSIARTILHNPKILILDEATSSVDTKTEKQIQKAIDVLVSGRTVISIAHRLSTLNNVDRIFVIEKGRIIEFGTHRELMSIKGEFYEMYIKQKKALELGGVIYT